MSFALLPIEIHHGILFHLSLKELVQNMTVCKYWYDLIHDIIKQSKTNQLTSKTLALIIKYDPTLIDYLFDSLTNKLKRQVCLLYSYLGQMELVTKYLVDIPWDHKFISYTISGHINRMISANQKISINIHEIIAEIPLVQKYGILNHVLDKYKLWLLKIQNFDGQRYLHAQVVYHQLPLDIQNKIDSDTRAYDLTDQNSLSTATLLIKYGNIIALQMMAEHGYPFDFQTYESAIYYDQLEVLKWLTTMMPIYQDVFVTAAKFGRMKILQWLHNDYHEHPDIYVDSIDVNSILCAAAKNNHLEIIKWYYQKSCHNEYNDIVIIFTAAAYKHQEIVHWILEHIFYTSDTFLRLTEVHRSELDPIFPRFICESNQTMIEWFLNYCPSLSYIFGDYAAMNGEISILDFIHNKYHFSYTNCLNIASKYNKLNVLKYIATIKPSMIKKKWHSCMALSMEYDNLKIVKWLLQYHYQYDASLLIKYNIYKIKKSDLDGGEIYYYNTNHKSIDYYQETINKHKQIVYQFWKTTFRNHHPFEVEL